MLVLERGPVADTWTSRVPLLSSNILSKDGPVRTWWSQPLRNANDRFVQVMTAEVLGGVSRINGLLYTRGRSLCIRLRHPRTRLIVTSTGAPGDYNHWKALGNAGWGYEDLEPYFVKSEKTYSHPPSQYRGRASGGMHPSNALLLDVCR